jgi:hypothetical protein
MQVNTELLAVLEKLKQQLEAEQQTTSVQATCAKNLYDEFNEYGTTEQIAQIEEMRIAKNIAHEAMLVAKKNVEWLPYLRVCLPRNFAVELSKIVCGYLPWLYSNAEDTSGHSVYFMEETYLNARGMADKVLWEQWKLEYAKDQDAATENNQTAAATTATTVAATTTAVAAPPVAATALVVYHEKGNAAAPKKNM